MPYEDEKPPDLKAYGRIVRDVAKRTGLEILVEPDASSSRMLAFCLPGCSTGNAAAGARSPCPTPDDRAAATVPLSGVSSHRTGQAAPTFECAHRRRRSGLRSGDFLALDREMPDIEAGDLLAVRTAGAYGYSMASNYNARPRAPEVLVDGDSTRSRPSARSPGPDAARAHWARMENGLMVIGLISDTHDRLPAIDGLVREIWRGALG